MAVEDILRQQIADAPTLGRLAFILEIYLDAVEIRMVDGKETVALKIERVLVERIGNVRIEIRTKEQGHEIAHFHVIGPDIDASFAIDNCEQLAGKSVGGTIIRKIRRFFIDDGGRERLLVIWGETRPSG